VITYVLGDATSPKTGGSVLLPHICNDAGGWGKGYVLAISRHWSEPELAFREWAATGNDQGLHDMPYQLGEIQVVQVTENPYTAVVNMVAQAGYRPTYEDDGKRYVDYDALSVCLTKLQVWATVFGCSVHMPKIGAGLGGGSWETIETLIRLYLAGTDVTVYLTDPNDPLLQR
jgi:O-acetyl-ADP-ribose deacetylase (regulator of RNase III)